jgi:capsular exopolysaccharide synthesis family protein
VVSNLSIVMAQAGRSVAILDCDLHRPSQHTQLGQLNRLGLSEIMLQEPLHLNGALRPAHIPNLALLPSGVTPPNPAELLGSKKMSQLLDLVAAQAEIVILDTPPLSALTDAAVLASKVDGVILVIETGRTRMADALHAKQQLERVGANIIGVVLNKVPISRRGYYSYYYQYYYYYYENEEKRARHPRKLVDFLFGRRGRRSRPVAAAFLASEPEAGVNESGVPASAAGDQAKPEPIATVEPKDKGGS